MSPARLDRRAPSARRYHKIHNDLWMPEPRTWPKKISQGGQIALPVELMRALNLRTGDGVYLVLWRGCAALVAEQAAAPLLKEVFQRAGVIADIPKTRPSKRSKRT